jgi:hypothetical protein
VAEAYWPISNEFWSGGSGCEMADRVQMQISDVGGVLLNTDDGAFVRELAQARGSAG